jgi:O-antigen ligase
MSSSLALIVCAVGIVGLFFLDRDTSIRTSKALWLPVIWIWIIGSRPVSEWLGINQGIATPNQLLDGSPTDQPIFAVLLILGLLVLIGRGRRTTVVLKTNWPIVVFFSYCLVSVLWSDFPAVALKRWVKAGGDLVMILIVVTDVEPMAALRRLFSRTGFVLLPASILLIKYFGDLGRSYDPFTGGPMNTGVTTNKNLLGVITLVLSLGALWRVLTLLRAKGELHRGRHLMAQSILLAFGATLLVKAHSATSTVSFALGAGLMFATLLPVFRVRPVAVHALIAVLVLAGAFTMYVGGQAEVVQAMGRQTNLTGRTEIWNAIIPMAPNPVVGAGFESFWLGPRLEKLWNDFPVLHLNEAHDGYIEVYLNLGWVGVSLIALILIYGYGAAVAALRRQPVMGCLMVAYVVAATTYNITEAGFRMLNPIWFFLLLIVAASGGASRAIELTQRPDGTVVDGFAKSSGNEAFHSFGEKV